MFLDLPVDAIGMHPIGPPPTEGDLLVAAAKSAREWISEVAVTLESTDPDHTTMEVRAFIKRIGIDLVDTYLNNLAKNTWLMDDCTPTVTIGPRNVGLWLWLSTEWMLAKDLLQMLMDRAMVYHPYAWNNDYCLNYETLEAKFWHKFLRQHNHASLQRHLAMSTQAGPTTPSPTDHPTSLPNQQPYEHRQSAKHSVNLPSNVRSNHSVNQSSARQSTSHPP